MHYKKKILPNGLRIITVPMKGTQTVTAIVMIGIGSRYENEKEAGLSHFIEHMFFKGTEKRPTFLSISEELDSIGGEFNAFTSKDRTGYYAKADAKHTSVILDVVSDIYLNSKIDEKEIEREKGTIIQELNMYEDTPRVKVDDVFENLLYNGSSLGREIIGCKETIQSFEREDFLRYMNKFYIAGDSVVCVAGKIEEGKIITQIEKYFSGMKTGVKPCMKKIKENQRKPALKIKNKQTDQTHFVLGCRALPDDHKDRFALGILSVILGGNMSSRLFVEVRERRGLAYSVHTMAEYYEECGYLAAKAGVEHKNLEQTVGIILNEYKKISSKKVFGKELQMAKDYIKGKSIMGLESSDEVAMFFVEQEMKRKNILTPDEIFKKIDAVSAADVLRVGKNIFKTKWLNLAVIGPHKNEKKLKKILNF